MEPTFVIKIDGAEVPTRGFSVKEMRRVKEMTGSQFRTRGQLIAGMIDEDPDALTAAYVVFKARDGVQVNFSDVDFDLDPVEGRWTDGEGRAVELATEKTADGLPKRDENGQLMVVKDENGKPVWIYSDTGDRAFLDAPEPSPEPVT